MMPRPRKPKAPTLAALRALAKRKGDNRPAKNRIFAFQPDGCGWRSIIRWRNYSVDAPTKHLARIGLHAMLSALPDANGKGRKE